MKTVRLLPRELLANHIMKSLDSPFGPRFQDVCHGVEFISSYGQASRVDMCLMLAWRRSGPPDEPNYTCLESFWKIPLG